MKLYILLLGFVIGSVGLAQDCPDGFRPVKHALETTCIPEKPERIVSLNSTVTDDLVALELMPAAVTTYNGIDFDSYEYMKVRLEGVPILGSFTEPNLEAILQLGPDLIVGREDELAEIYPELSAIAPTVALADETSPEVWLERTAEVAGVDAAARLGEYNETMLAFRDELSGALLGESAAFLRVQPDQLRLYSSSRLGGPILYGRLGLGIPDIVAGIPEEESYIELSLESLPGLANVEHIFLLDQSEEGRPAQLLGSPLWQALPAVQAGNVYTVSRDIWISLGIIANEEVAADIVAKLTETP